MPIKKHSSRNIFRKFWVSVTGSYPMASEPDSFDKKVERFIDVGVLEFGGDKIEWLSKTN